MATQGRLNRDRRRNFHDRQLRGNALTCAGAANAGAGMVSQCNQTALWPVTGSSRR
jgi:hypothetical protein